MQKAMKVKYDFFISYSSLDIDLATRIERSLTNKSYSVYRDRSRLEHGKDYRTQLYDAIENSTCMIVVWSENSVRSRYVPDEVDLAEKNGSHIIPINIDGCIPIGYDKMHSLNMKKDGYGETISKIQKKAWKVGVIPKSHKPGGLVYIIQTIIGWSVIAIVFVLIIGLIRYCSNSGQENSSLLYNESYRKTEINKDEECYTVKKPQISHPLNISDVTWKNNISLYCHERTVFAREFLTLKSSSTRDVDKVNNYSGRFNAIGHVSIDGERFYVTRSTFGREKNPRLIYISRK